MTPMAKAIPFASIYRRERTPRKLIFGRRHRLILGQRQLQIDPSQGPVASQVRKTPFGFLAACIIAVLLVLLAGFSAWRWWVPSTPLSEKASIPVLPFESIGNDPKWDRFADGITEDIVTDLSHSKDLFVVARNSTEVYRGKPADVRNVGRDLRSEEHTS